MRGTFVDGDTVDVCTANGEVFARGMVLSGSADLRPVVGRHTGDLPEGMIHEVIHRDDLVLL